MSKANLQERLRHWVSIASPDRLRIVAEAFATGDTYSQSLAAEMRSLAFMLETTPSGTPESKPPTAAKLTIEVDCDGPAQFDRLLERYENGDLSRFHVVAKLPGSVVAEIGKGA